MVSGLPVDVDLHHGDALTVLRTLADDSADLVLTDPPYSSGGAFRGDRNRPTREKYLTAGAKVDHLESFDGDSRDQRSFALWCTLWMTECWRVQRPGSAIVAFIDWRQLPTMTDAVQAAGFVWRGIGVWSKGRGRPMSGISNGDAEYLVWGTKGASALPEGVYLPTILEAPRIANGERVHQTQKPEGILHRLVELAPPGGLVVDPFAGSGSTLVAARNMGRRALGIELSPHYCEVTASRFAQTTLDVPA